MSMNMMQMVGIMVALYVIALTALCIFRKSINVKVLNVMFIIVDLVFFIVWSYASYLRGWTDGFMMLDNISPFIMTMIPLSVFVKDGVREAFKSATAFLWVGMFVALIVSPQQAYIFSENTEASLAYSSEAACHLIASLYGIYLIITEQVQINLKSWRRALVFLYSAIGFGVVMNYIFHLDNFGMDPYGNYSIYMIDIFGSFWATFAAYLLGVLVVITLGMQGGYLLMKLIAMGNADTEVKAQDSADGEETPEETGIEAEQTEDCPDEETEVEQAENHPEEERDTEREEATV